MSQKIIKVGNSAAVTIPKRYLKELDLKPGDWVEVDRVSDGVGVYKVASKKNVSSSVVTGELADWLSGFHKRYGKALKELADK